MTADYGLPDGESAVPFIVVTSDDPSKWNAIADFLGYPPDASPNDGSEHDGGREPRTPEEWAEWGAWDDV